MIIFAIVFCWLFIFSISIVVFEEFFNYIDSIKTGIFYKRNDSTNKVK